jgi:hypothetical protein
MSVTGADMTNETSWFWRREGAVYGPLSEARFEARIRSGAVVPGTSVRRASDPRWKPLEAVERWSAILEEEHLERSKRQRAQRVRVGAWAAGVAVLIGAASSVAMWGGSPPPAAAKEAPAVEPIAGIDHRADGVYAAVGAGELQDGAGHDTLAGNELAQGFRQALPGIVRCAKRFRLTGGEIPAQLKVRFTVHGSGTVGQAHVLPDYVANSPMARCMVGVIRRLDYPSFSGKPRTVTFPLQFK